jgi:mRNA interferase HigB
MPLRVWAKAVKDARWTSFADVRLTFRTVDVYKSLTIFEIGGNKYRLIAAIHYNTGLVYVLHVLTHKEYGTDNWKKSAQ